MQVHYGEGIANHTGITDVMSLEFRGTVSTDFTPLTSSWPQASPLGVFLYTRDELIRCLQNIPDVRCQLEEHLAYQCFAANLSIAQFYSTLPKSPAIDLNCCSQGRVAH